MSSNLQNIAPDGVMGAAITTVVEQMDKLDLVSEKYRRQLTT